MPTAANAGYYAGIVAEKAVLRRLVEAGTRVVQYGYAGADGADVAEVVDRAQAEIYDVTEDRGSEDYRAAGGTAAADHGRDRRDRSPAAGIPGVPTGFAELDEVTTGLHGGQMIIVAARPGMGRHWRSTHRCPHRLDGRRWAMSRSGTSCWAPTGSRRGWWPRPR